MDAVKTIDCPNCGTPNKKHYETVYDYFKRENMLDYVSLNKEWSNSLVIHCVKCGQWILKDKPFTRRTFGQSDWAMIKIDEKVPLYCEDCKTPLELISCVQKKYLVIKCYIYCPLCQYQEELLYENHRKNFRFAFTGFIPSDLKSKAISVNQKK